MKAKYFIQLLLIFGLCSCNYRMQERKLAFDIISEFNLLRITNPVLCASDDKVFVTNIRKQTDGEIYEYNYNGELLSKFGQKGAGPNEFTNIFNLFYDYKRKLLGIYEPFKYSISFYNDNNSLVEKQKLKKVIFNNVFTSDSNLLRYYYSHKGENLKYRYLHDVYNNNSEPISIKEKEVISKGDHSTFKESTRIAANMDFFFIWDLNGNETSVEQFDVEGNPVKKWDLEMLPRYLENIKKHNRIHAGDDFILYDFQDNNDVHFYDAYDFKNKYLGTIRMSKPEDTIPFVFKDKIFMLEYNEQDDEDFYVCKILKMK